MFFGLIPHDRLNYAAIKMEKCPLRAHLPNGWGFSVSDVLLRLRMFHGSMLDLVQANAWKAFSHWKDFPSLPTRDFARFGENYFPLKPRRLSSLPPQRFFLSHKTINSAIARRKIKSFRWKFFGWKPFRRRSGVLLLCMAFLCYVILFSLLCFCR